MKKLFKSALHLSLVSILSITVIVLNGFFGKNKNIDKEGQTTTGGLFGLGAETARADVPTPPDDDPGSDCDGSSSSK